VRSMADQNQIDTKQRNANPEAAAITNAIPSPADSDRATQQFDSIGPPQQRRHQMRPFERWSLAFSTVGILVGSFVAWIYFGQLEEMKVSTKAAKDSAVAASANVEAARVEQRAWVVITYSLIQGEPTLTEPFRLRTTATNTGKTPAIHRYMQGWVGGKRPIVPMDWTTMPKTPYPPLFPTVDPRFSDQAPFLFVDKTSWPDGLSGMQRYLSGKTDLWVVSRMTYCDVFDRLHWVQTCGHHTFGQPLGTFSGCETGDEIDDAQIRACRAKD
jgi:hypothetical protein